MEIPKCYQSKPIYAEKLQDAVTAISGKISMTTRLKSKCHEDTLDDNN